MLGTFKTPSYSGNESYRYVEELIKNGREILIVSPYIDSYYANFLLNHSSKRKFTIISSSMDPKAKSLLTKGRFPFWLAIPIVAFLASDTLLYYLGMYIYFWLLAIVIASMLIVLALFARRKKSNIRIKIPDQFVHAKLYLSERKAIQGSANLTYKGMHKNIEHIEITEDPMQIEALKRQFWEIWGKSSV